MGIICRAVLRYGLAASLSTNTLRGFFLAQVRRSEDCVPSYVQVVDNVKSGDNWVQLTPHGIRRYCSLTGSTLHRFVVGGNQCTPTKRHLNLYVRSLKLIERAVISRRTKPL